jgi:general stress protein 26
MPANPQHIDPYSEAAKNPDLTPQDKIDGLKQVVAAAKIGMLTTRDKNGRLHSRAMAPVVQFPHMLFFANNASGKFEDIDSNHDVNLSFYDHSSTNWASVTGRAKVNNDRELIKKHWSTMHRAWFGDLGDGVHKGNSNDPRISLIEVVPEEIRYWYTTKGKVAQTVEIAASAVTGHVAAPGEIRVITAQELELVEGLHVKA